ncbi:MAG: aldehyde dehydrogenase family protein [Desulfatitalea sp.]|nr:aldehyde dehydrogenase family protein [Desulfatitalea sp.]NNK00388.1 aldehyde dehydrogenase family protein [Desulfatitalea sp.]
MQVRKFQLFIDGKFVDSQSGMTFESINPHDQSTVGIISKGDIVDLNAAVAAARAAYDGRWSRVTPGEKARLLNRLADLLEANTDDLSRLESMDNGMPLALSAFSVADAVNVIRYWAGMTSKIHGLTSTAMRPGEFHGYSLREPVGVVGGITPWNAPLMMAVWKTAPALACGNTVVLKPASLTPCTALALANLYAQAGFPEGTVNVVPGSGEAVGSALAEHMDVDKIAITGDHVTGRRIVEMSASNLKTVTLELGGKSPHIIFEDADLDTAVGHALIGLFTNSGQACVAGTRLLVHEAIHDRFVERFIQGAEQIPIGNPLDPSTRMGPLASASQLRKVQEYVEVGKQEGAILCTGGHRPTAPECANGFYFAPTLFTGVDNRMRIAQEEIFGPVGVVIKFRDDEQALCMANDVIYGLAAGLQTKDLKRAHRFASRLQAGTVWINTWHMVEANTPFGGYKLSGYGRENGFAMIEHLTRLKQVWVDLNDSVGDLLGA